LVLVTAIFILLQRTGGEISADAQRGSVVRQFDSANHDLREGMVDQETGLRGYELTSDASFLEPYHSGGQLINQALGELNRSAAPGDRSALAAEGAAVSYWQAWAQEEIVGVGKPTVTAATGDVEGRRLFDAFRASWDAVNRADQSQILAAQNALLEGLGRLQTIRQVGWFLITASLAMLATLIFLSILRPLLRQAQVAASLDGERLADIPGLGRSDEIGQLAAALAALQRTLKDRVMLGRTMHELTGETNRENLVQNVLPLLADLVEADEAVITMLIQQKLFIAGSLGGTFEPGKEASQATFSQSAMARGAPVIAIVADMPEGTLKQCATQAGLHSVLVAPMVAGGSVVGTIAGLRRADRPVFDQDDAQRMAVIAPSLGAALTVSALVNELRDANSVKSRFLANMSHELRTPLNAILGFSQVLSAEDFGPLNDRQHRYTGHIETSGRRLLELINDILDLAKVEAGLMDVSKDTIELEPVLRDSRSQVERMVGTKGLTLEYQLSPGLYVSADARRLHQVVLNLLSNAVKFTPEGGHITIAAAQRAQQVEVTVSDSGIGIPAGELDLIFNEFAQASTNESRDQQGTGLGLALSRKLAELMGGRLTAESELGKGSRFTLTLRSEPAPMRPLSGPLVLVVEDEQPNTELLRAILEEAGYRVVTAEDARHVAAAIARERPEVVLLDIKLPGPDGWTVLDDLKANPRTAGVPVIAVTALDEASPDRRDLLAGFMTKPVDRAALIALLGRLALTPDALALVRA